MKYQSAQPELIREINRSRLFEILKRDRIVSRYNLARHSGLSRTTVAISVDEMLRVGLAEEIGPGDSTGGRPPGLLRFNPNAVLALGAHLAQRKWSIVATDLDAHVVEARDVRVEGDSPEAAVEALRRGVVDLQASVKHTRILPAIGLATPGLVDVHAGVIKTAVDVGWSEIPIKKLVEDALGITTYVANRSKVGALAELWYGAGRDVSDLIYISIGTGIAAGIVHQRQLYLGANSSAGELGHVTVLPDGPRCPCGNRGCLQQLAAGPAIADSARARLREGRTSILRDLVGNHPELIKAETVFRAAEQGDALALEVVAESGRYLGIAVANLINLFNPELVVLGGPIGRDSQVLLKPLQQEVRLRAMTYPLSITRIVPSALRSDASAVGAATLVLQQASALVFSTRTESDLVRA